MSKQARHFAIKEIISTQEIRSQEDLRLQLKGRGIDVTQATLSRDLRDLGVGRGLAGQGLKYLMQPEAEVKILRPIVGAEVLSIGANESTIVIRTLPGCANSVGEYVDIQNHPGIIGTLAGDNAVLVIPASTESVEEIVHYLKAKLIEGM
ncbi:MAG: arginine repressor [Bacteroidota bacterium]